VEAFGVTLIGINAETGHKILLTLGVLVGAIVVRIVLGTLARVVLKRRSPRGWFWTRQGVSLAVVLLGTVGVLSIWFDDTRNLASFIGLFTAGIAFALQKVITSAAGYLLILRGKSFELGDRIQMGGVRGDVIGLGFLQTIIMEMGQTPPEQRDQPAMWVNGRQFSGRIVTVSNSVVFDEPVFNYTRDFPFIWEEIRLPVRYGDDRARAEEILLEAARRHTSPVAEIGAHALEAMRRRYHVQAADLEPRVFLRLTDSWVELALRFVVPEHGIREIKDAISRDILDALEGAGISLASTTFEIVGVSPLHVRHAAEPFADPG
jgi:small-conductance mechanosensitive channel